MPYPPWFTPVRIPMADECSIAAALRRRSARDPDGICAVFASGTRWTNAQALSIAHGTAAAMARLGVAPGQRVVLWLPNSAALLRVLFGCALLGAVPVPLNTALKGRLLGHALSVAKPALIVTHASLVETLTDVVATGEQAVVALGGGALPAGILGPEALDPEALDPDREPELPCHPEPQPWDLAAILFTSGTTGKSKGVRVPNGQLWSIAKAHFGFLTPQDRMLVTTPLCHIGPLSGLVGALIHDSALILLENFRTQSFWDEIRRFGATSVPGMGPSLLHFLNKQPVRPDDAENTLRIVNVTTVSQPARDFARRFGVDFFASYGMTEISVALATEVNSTVEKSCGRPRDGIEVRLVDENDIEVPVGQAGQIVVRSIYPWTLNDGYEGMPDATVAAWRNGWFHTGDIARRDADGNFHFEDRIKDMIRRRGENISSMEVEREAAAFPGVKDAAAVGVTSEVGDQEILLAVSTMPGAGVDPRELIEFLIGRLPHYMVPRYVRLLDELPKTPSNKVQKSPLRDAGATPECWDRETSALSAKRTVFGNID